LTATDAHLKAVAGEAAARSKAERLEAMLGRLQQKVDEIFRGNLDLNEIVASRDRQLQDLNRQLEDIEQSTVWRATAVLRATGSRLPQQARRQLRRAARAAYWVLTPHRTPARITFLRQRRKAARERRQAAGQVSAEPAAGPEFRSEVVDIIVCVHNALDDVQRCLASIVQRTMPPYRIIIVDDGSEARTHDYLKAFAQENKAV